MKRKVVRMKKQMLLISDDVTAVYYNFSEYMVCVDVKKNGKSLGSFCSDVRQFNEWDTDELIELVKSHVRQMEKAESYNHADNHQLSDGLEIKFHKHWDNFYCVDVMNAGKQIGSFCADRASFEEWMEDKGHLEEVVRTQVNL